MTAFISADTFKTQREQRSETRLPVFLPAIVEVCGTNYSVGVLNLAPSGVMIETSAPLAVRSRVTFHCGTITTQATVAWQAEGHTGLRFNRILADPDVAEQVTRSYSVAARRESKRSVRLKLARRAPSLPDCHEESPPIVVAGLAPPPKSVGKPMSELVRMREQHSELMVLAQDLSRLTSKIDVPCRIELSQVRRRLASSLIRHLKEEDWVVYPTLLRSQDHSRREVGRALQLESGTLAEAFSTYMLRWNTFTIEQDWPRYRKETSDLLTTLKRRITREDTQLYGAVANDLFDSRMSNEVERQCYKSPI